MAQIPPERSLPAILPPHFHPDLQSMERNPLSGSAGLFDERASQDFRSLFGDLLSRSETLETAILRIRLGAVDLSAHEVAHLRHIRLLVAEVSARTLEEEAYALLVDPERRDCLRRVFGLLQRGILEIRSAPLGGWSPDFSVFSLNEGPFAVLIGLHWFQKPFAHRGPAWGARFGPEEGRHAAWRFRAIWDGAHDIGPAIHRLLDRTTRRWDSRSGSGDSDQEGPPDPLDAPPPPNGDPQGKNLLDKEIRSLNAPQT